LRAVAWAIDVLNMAEGEGITMYLMTKTDDEKEIARQISGAEAAVVQRNTGTVSTLEQNMNKRSAVKDKKNAGFLTITADLAILRKMVEDIADDPN